MLAGLTLLYHLKFSQLCLAFMIMTVHFNYTKRDKVGRYQPDNENATGMALAVGQ